MTIAPSSLAKPQSGFRPASEKPGHAAPQALPLNEADTVELDKTDWGTAVKAGDKAFRKQLLSNFTLSALLTWLPVPLIHLNPLAGVAVFGLGSLSSFIRATLTNRFPWLNPATWPGKLIGPKAVKAQPDDPEVSL